MEVCVKRCFFCMLWLPSDSRSRPGRSLLFSHYKGSVNNFVRAMMPEHNWLEWRFVKVSKKFWLSKEHQRQFLSWAARELKLASVDDWRFVSMFQMRAVGGSSTNSSRRFVQLSRPNRDPTASTIFKFYAPHINCQLPEARLGYGVG
jgi:hypothetical protein